MSSLFAVARTFFFLRVITVFNVSYCIFMLYASYESFFYKEEGTYNTGNVPKNRQIYPGVNGNITFDNQFQRRWFWYVIYDRLGGSENTLPWGIAIATSNTPLQCEMSGNPIIANVFQSGIAILSTLQQSMRCYRPPPPLYTGVPTDSQFHYVYHLIYHIQQNYPH